MRTLDATLLPGAPAGELDAGTHTPEITDLTPMTDASLGSASPSVREESPAPPDAIDAGHPPPMQDPSDRDGAVAALLDADSPSSALSDARVGCDLDTFEGSFAGAVDGLVVDLTVSGLITFQVPASTTAQTSITDGQLRGESKEGHSFAARLDATWDCSARSLSSGRIADGVITYDASTPVSVPFSGAFAGAAIQAARLCEESGPSPPCSLRARLGHSQQSHAESRGRAQQAGAGSQRYLPIARRSQAKLSTRTPDA